MSTPQPEPDFGSPTTKLLRLRVTAEADPSALARIVGSFQNLNLVPRRLKAEVGSRNELYVEVDVTDLSEHRLTIIAGKVAQIPSVLDAYWHHL